MRIIHTDKLLTVARLQYELFGLCYDIENECLHTDGRESEYQTKLNQLEAAKADLRKAEIDARGYCGAYWWNIPWTQTYQVLLDSLEANVTDGKWRMQTKVCEENTGSESVLYVLDEGHFSSFSGDSHNEYGQISAYSAEERREMVQELRDRYKANEAYNMFATSGPVYSSKQDKVYDSAADYYASWEYNLNKQREIDFYESTLVRDTVTTHTTLRSNSLHYKSAFAFGSYSVNENGDLCDLVITPYKMLQAAGSGADYAGQGLLKKSEKVLVAAYIARSSSVRRIPVRVLNDMLVLEVADYQAAVADSAAITCMAGKFCGNTLGVEPAFFKSREHFQQLQALFTRLDKGEDLSEKELKQVLDTVNRDYLRQDEMFAAQVKSYAMERLALDGEDFDEALYYAVRGEDIAEEALKRYPESPVLAQVAAQLQTLLAENYLQNGHKDLAAFYAQRGLNSCERLRRKGITDQLSVLEKVCAKTLKKATKKGWFS